VKGLQADGLDYTGFIFIGLMIDGDEPFVIEYNCRMGDPETEVVIPRIKNDLVKMLEAAAGRTLHTISIDTDQRSAVATVAVSGGYPGDFKKGEAIHGLSDITTNESILFHAATVKKENDILTNGGRVLISVAFGENMQEAAQQSRQLLQQISFAGMNYRKDIGYEF